MALGGGYFVTYNKILPGAYINFVSAARASSSMSERGYATIPLELDWGIEDAIFTVTKEDFIKNTKKIFGYDYTHEKMKGLRDFFINATTGHFYKLNHGIKASNEIATALYSGTRGNDITIVIQNNIDDENKFNVITKFDNKEVDLQIVKVIGELKKNDYVEFNLDATLSATAGIPLSGGTNGDITGENYQTYLDKIEPYYYNSMGCLSTDEAVKSLFIAFQKRMREEVGAKFQLILHQVEKADNEGVISLENTTADKDYSVTSAVFWLTGAEAACPINKSLENKSYDGEFVIQAEYTQTQLIQGIKEGKFLFHKEGEEIRVLKDINTFISFTKEKNEDFAENQVIRTLDQIAIDIAAIFKNYYIGKINGNAAGRLSFWNDITKHHQNIEKIGAIEDFNVDNVIVQQGETRKQVIVADKVKPSMAMSQLYMTVAVA